MASKQLSKDLVSLIHQHHSIRDYSVEGKSYIDASSADCRLGSCDKVNQGRKARSNFVTRYF